MGSSAYRMAPEQPTKTNIHEDVPDSDLVVAFIVIWVASLARVVCGLLVQETFGTEPTVALLIVVLLPVRMRDALWKLVTRGLRRLAQ